MNDTHLKNSHSLYNQHKLRPVVIAVTAAIGVSGLLVGCGGGGSNGGGKKGAIIYTSGGTSGKTTGIGGDGGEVNFYAYDTAGGLFQVLNKKKDAPAIPDIPDPVLGAEPLEITDDTTIPVDDPLTAPDGEYYQVVDECSIYLSDGDGMTADVAVTGVEIAKGATLTLEETLGGDPMAVPPVLPDTACIRVDNDIVNDGTVMTATQGSSLWLYMDNFFGSGPLSTSGGDTVADAGNLYIGADTAIYNQGDLSATGYDSETAGGGFGGYIWLDTSTGDLWNRGKLTTSGGNSTFATGAGGDGGEVYLYADIGADGGGTLYNAGAIDTTGGDGDGDGGDGGYVGAWIDGPAAVPDMVASSNAYNLAGIDTRGGAVTGEDGSGGDGGEIWMALYPEGGSFNVLGVKKIEATGGDGAEGGGSSDGVYFYSDDTDADYTNEAEIDTSGGDAMVSGAGGDGGNIELYNDGSSSTIDNSGNLTANGGSGVNEGGDGGNIYLYIWDGGVANTGSITNSGKLTSRGGDHTGDNPAEFAGDGGYVEVEIDGSADGATGTVSNTGAIDTTGGNSTNGIGGDGGPAEVEIENALSDPDNSVSNTADITTNGGVGGVDGGEGGYVDFYSPGVETTNSGAISTQGGAGDTGNGGNGGSVTMYGEPVTNKGNINASGANGKVNGGNGGSIDLYSTGGTDTNNTGKLTSAGGSGDTLDGTDGTITIDGVPQ
jgi:hypothetical protein